VIWFYVCHWPRKSPSLVMSFSGYTWRANCCWHSGTDVRPDRASKERITIKCENFPGATYLRWPEGLVLEEILRYYITTHSRLERCAFFLLLLLLLLLLRYKEACNTHERMGGPMILKVIAFSGCKTHAKDWQCRSLQPTPVLLVNCMKSY